MRAAVLRGWRQPLDLCDLPDPAPAPGGVVLKVLACGVCRSDWHAWTGADPDIALPIVPGHEYCGEVVATGAGVSRWCRSPCGTTPITTRTIKVRPPVCQIS